jgi:hypothetical protein
MSYALRIIHAMLPACFKQYMGNAETVIATIILVSSPCCVGCAMSGADLGVAVDYADGAF